MVTTISSNGKNSVLTQTSSLKKEDPFKEYISNNPDLVRERIHNFLGYGNLSGNIWFVGMEEGGNETPEILLSRFRATSQGQMFDIFDDMREHPDHMRWFKENAPTQATYRKLIYLLLFLRSRKEPSIDDIREYQIKSFERKSADHAVLELMPLPSKTIEKKDWIYGDLGIEELSTRKKYLSEFKSNRVELFRSLVEQHKPKLVIFYSRTYLKDWQKIAETSFSEIIPKKLLMTQRDGTTFAVVPHSVARGHSDEVWKTIAEGIISAHPFFP